MNGWIVNELMNDELSFQLPLKKNERKHHLHVESDSVEYVVLGIKMLPGPSSSGAQGN